MPPIAPVTEISRSGNPFPVTGVSRDANGIPHYDELPATLLDMLAEQVDRRPESEAVVELGAGRLTYRQLWDRAARVAGGLRADGLKPGDRVGVRYPAGLDWVLAFWGTVMAGGIAVAVNTRSAQPEVDFVLSDAGAQLDLVADAALPDGQPYVTENVTRSDTAALFYTSGTTGHPKGVPTTHEAFLTNTENAVRCLRQPRDIGDELRTLISVPLFHVTGCNSQLLAATYLGGAAVIMPALDLDELIATLSTERVSLMVTVPAIYSLLLRHKELPAADVSGVRWVGYGGAPIAPSLVRSVKNAFPQATVFTDEHGRICRTFPDQIQRQRFRCCGYRQDPGDAFGKFVQPCHVIPHPATLPTAPAAAALTAPRALMQDGLAGPRSPSKRSHGSLPGNRPAFAPMLFLVLRSPARGLRSRPCG